MVMARQYTNRRRKKHRFSIDKFIGQTKQDKAKLADNEFTYLRGLGSAQYPYLESYAINSSSKTLPVNTVKGACEYRAISSNTDLVELFVCTVETSTLEIFKYENNAPVSKQTIVVTADDNKLRRMTQFKDKIIILPDKLAYDVTNNTLEAVADIPDLTACVTHKNRLCGVYENEIHISSLGDYKVWSTSADIADLGDSGPYSTAMNTIGNTLTGLVSFNNMLVCFTDSSMHTLYGDYPSNYYQNDVPGIGCASHELLQVIDGQLYFLSSHGLLRFNRAGGFDKLAFPSDRFYLGRKSVYNSGVTAGAIGNYYVFSNVGIGSNTYAVMAYDVHNNVLFEIDNSFETNKLVSFIIDNSIIRNDSIYKFSHLYSDTDLNISWEIETKDFTEDVNNKKRYLSLYLYARFDEDVTTNIQLYVSVDNGEYEFIYDELFNRPDLQVIEIPMNLQPCNNIKFKLVGEGPITLERLDREFTVTGR